jgi:hypothetical protein
MSILQPTFLWTLAAIAVPLAIHLLSRKEGKIVKVGSLRHLEASTTSRFKSLRLNELWLLLARCLMITWLALFLSGATCSSPKDQTDWLLTEQGMDKDPRVTTLIDSLTNAGFEWRTLAEGFPFYDPDLPDAQQPDYRALVNDLSTEPVRNTIVLSYNLAVGFRQTQASLPENVRWIPVDPPGQEVVLKTSRIHPDSILIRAATSTSAATSFANRKAIVRHGQAWFANEDHSDSVRIESRDTVHFAIVHDTEHVRDAHVLRASIQAVASIHWIAVVETDVGAANWIFWLQSDEPERPFTVPTVLMKPVSSTRWFSRVDAKEWHLNRRITSDDAVRDHLTIELARTFALELPAHKLAYKKDARSLPEAIAWSAGNTVSAKRTAATQDASLWLILFFVVTWAIERTLALRKNL